MTLYTRFRSPVPPGGRRVKDPVDEALIARVWHLRREYEEDGYVFSDHPPARLPW